MGVESGLHLLSTLLSGCIGGILFFGGKHLLQERCLQPDTMNTPLLLNYSDRYHANLPEKEPILKMEVDLLLCESKSVPSLRPNNIAEDRTGNNDCFSATEKSHFTEKKEDEESKTEKVSTFGIQAVVVSSETNCVSKESAMIHYGSADPLERRNQFEGKTDKKIIRMRETAEHLTSNCNGTSKSMAYSNSCLSDKGEDPLTFFRNFLSTDKERRSQPNLQKSKRRRKRCSKSKAPLSPLSPSSLSTNLLGENRSTTHAVFRKYIEEDLQQQELRIKNYVACDDSATISSPGQKKRDQRTVRFADEEGRDMETVFQISSRHLGGCGTNDRRVLILLLLPKKQLFEFVGLEYSMTSCQEDKENGQSISISIGKILRELPQLATDPIVSKERYVALLRADEKSGCNACSPLADSASIQSCNLGDDEVLLAVPSTGSPEVTLESAKTILQNKKLLRSVSTLYYYAIKALHL